MSEHGPTRGGTVRGRIRRRLLVNAVVDPDEAGRRLPPGLRPHVVGDGTVVGCCLLDVAAVRPAGLPVVVGARLRAAGHRISVEWDDEPGVTTVGVYVPLRLTNSPVALAVGGRVLPGVHRRAGVEVTHDGERLAWSVDAHDEPSAYSVHVAARSSGAPLPRPPEPIGRTCLSAEVGLSPRHDGTLEAARMTPRHRQAERVEIDYLDSAFLASFRTALPAPCYLMRDVDVTWGRAHVRPLQRIGAFA